MAGCVAVEFARSLEGEWKGRGGEERDRYEEGVVDERGGDGL
jgi:hypothetical protein